MDDHIGAAIFFEAMFDFLHYYYFPRVIFGPVYLAPHKTFVFSDQLDFVGFTADKNGLRPSIKQRERIKHWPTPTSKEEVEAFLWLTSMHCHPTKKREQIYDNRLFGGHRKPERRSRPRMPLSSDEE